MSLAGRNYYPDEAHNPLVPPAYGGGPDNGRFFNTVCVRNERKQIAGNFNNPAPNFPLQGYFPQLAAAVPNPPQPVSPYEQLKSHFKKYDTNGDGRLSEHELRRAFASLGSRFPLVRVWSAMEEADRDGDGYIGPNEWDALIRYTMSWLDGRICSSVAYDRTVDLQ